VQNEDNLPMEPDRFYHSDRLDYSDMASLPSQRTSSLGNTGRNAELSAENRRFSPLEAVRELESESAYYLPDQSIETWISGRRTPQIPDSPIESVYQLHQSSQVPPVGRPEEILTDTFINEASGETAPYHTSAAVEAPVPPARLPWLPATPHPVHVQPTQQSELAGGPSSCLEALRLQHTRLEEEKERLLEIQRIGAEQARLQEEIKRLEGKEGK
jgi:hypothetical protein